MNTIDVVTVVICVGSSKFFPIAKINANKSVTALIINVENGFSYSVKPLRNRKTIGRTIINNSPNIMLIWIELIERDQGFFVDACIPVKMTYNTKRTKTKLLFGLVNMSFIAL